MIERKRSIFVGLCLCALVSGLVVLGSAVAFADEAAVFEMEEMSVFGNDESARRSDLTRGQAAQCQREPDEQVKVYPKFVSKRPLYGKVTFDRNYLEPDTGIEFHFAIDESGSVPADAESSQEAKSLLRTLGAALSGDGETDREEDRPSPTPIRHDRLYFDLNRDLDLTNDPVLTPMENPPAGAMPSWEAKEKVAYDFLTVELDFGPELGTRPVRLLPRLMVSEHEGEEYASVYFIATTARKGTIKIGPREYEAVLGQRYLVSGRFDRPYTTLLLTPVGSPNEREHWWGVDELGAMRNVDGGYYSISATPTGEKLLVKPYDGEFGVLQMGSGGRDNIDKMSVSGSLRSEQSAVAVGKPGGGTGWSLASTNEMRLPVGDYMPNLIAVEYGRLRISMSHNYHSDGKPRERQGKPLVYGIEIRKDKPYVFNFSNKPAVMFASPAKDQTVKLGDQIEVKPVLIDPVLDVMIRGLDDTGRTKEVTSELSGGGTTSYTRSLSLDPTVVITDSAGERVVEGTTPFG